MIFSTVNYVATLSGMGFGMWFFGDAPSAYIWGAVVVMFAGLFLVTTTGRREAATS